MVEVSFDLAFGRWRGSGEPGVMTLDGSVWLEHVPPGGGEYLSLLPRRACQ